MAKKGSLKPGSAHTIYAIVGALFVIAIAVVAFSYFYSGKMHFGNTNQESEVSVEDKQRVLDGMAREHDQASKSEPEVSVADKTKQLKKAAQTSETGETSAKESVQVSESEKLRILEAMQRQQ